MSGGPSQMDTFDLKPGHANGGPFKEIATAAPGVKISEHLPGIAKEMKDLAIVRSLSTTEGEHGLATQLMLTGYQTRNAGVQYPSLGSLMSKELGGDDSDLPNFISLSPMRMVDAGFLGPNYAPLTVSGASDDPERPGQPDAGGPRAADRPRSRDRSRTSSTSCGSCSRSSAASSDAAKAHQASYDKAMRMVETQARKAFQLEEEKPELRDAYGRNLFGQGCLLARRLVERGVPFVEVTLAGTPGGVSGWDTHGDNFNAVRTLSGFLDPALATLMEDLNERGLLGIDAGRLDGRVRPHAEDQRRRRPRPLPERLERGPRRRGHQGRPGLRQDHARRDGSGRRQGQRVGPVRHDLPRGRPQSERKKTSRPKAGRSRWPIAAESRSKLCSCG